MNHVDQYIVTFPEDTQQILQQIRQLIRTASPDAEESMAYGMPAYKLNKKPLIYFAAYSKHIGLYATPAAHQQFADELAGYKQGKGSVQFPLDQEMPLDLIRRIIEFKVQENQKKKKKLNMDSSKGTRS
ncbi:MAG: DUF1801 domain-containing protein [Calditrichaeota bacterium]|nr:DUF1801 domain-containing protein [Calditrichota bacterium]